MKRQRRTQFIQRNVHLLIFQNSMFFFLSFNINYSRKCKKKDNDRSRLPFKNRLILHNELVYTQGIHHSKRRG